MTPQMPISRPQLSLRTLFYCTLCAACFFAGIVVQRQRAADRDYDQVRRPRSLIVEVFDPTPQEQSDQLVAGGGSAAGRVSLARDIIRDRQAAGLTQAELAALARTRQETILRIESGKYTASHRLIDRIDRALTRAATKRKTKGR